LFPKEFTDSIIKQKCRACCGHTGKSMRVQIAFKALATSLLLSALTGCGGAGFGSGTTGGTTGGSTTGATTGGIILLSPSSTPAHISVVASAGTLDTTTGSTAYTISASITDANNVAVSDATVAFASSAPVLSAASAVTDSTGVASVTLTIAANQSAGIITITGTDKDVTGLAGQTTITIAAASNLALGIRSSAGAFTSGQITIGQSPLAAAGSSSIEVDLVDTANSNALYTTSTAVAFTSPCIASGNATITSPVTSSTGVFDTTYKASGCVGNDVITATASVAGSPTASGTISVMSASLGSIQFTSPTTAVTLGLKGTGLSETQVVEFTVFDANGNPVPNQTVSFSLSTSVGGISLSATSASSDNNGIVSTIVSSGTVHTVVRVIASATKSNGAVLTTQSNQITVSTGFPAQNSMSLAASQLNLVGNDVDGNTTNVTVRMSDRYNNPVPNGTAVAFTTECGQIEPSCTTTDGGCSVTFTTQNPRTSTLVANGMATPAAGGSCSIGDHEQGCDDHRCTVLATAVGEESFVDCNGTGEYVSVANPANNSSQCPNGDLFTSLPEAFLDSNENDTRQGNTEPYVDFNGNGSYDIASGKFVGLLCSSANGNCDASSSLNVRQSLVIVMTSSDLVLTPSPTALSIPVGGSETIDIVVSDTAGQVPPVLTTVKAGLTTGTFLGPSSYTVANTNSFGQIIYSFTVQAPTTAGSDSLVINATTPSDGTNTSGVVTTLLVPVTYR
jgi:hypothetical protein